MTMSKFVSYFVLSIWCNAVLSYELTIQEALKKNQVKVELSSNGKSLEEGMITAIIQNSSMMKLEVKIPIGTMLAASEDDRQNLILVQEEILVLAPNDKKSLLLKGMCTQASNKSPGSEIAYSFGKTAEGDLLACAKMIHADKIINSCGQEAIWAFTDNHEVGWINAENDKEMALRQFVAEKKGVENPWFTTNHNGGNNQLSDNYNPMQPTEDYYNMTGAEIKGDFQWNQDTKKKLTFAVYDSEGKELRRFFENKEFEYGEFTFKFFYKTTRNLRGTYYAKLSSGNQIIQEAAFTF